MQRKNFCAIFLMAMLLSISAINLSSVFAQGNATVTVETTTGGSTNITGTNSYPDGSPFTITATPTYGYAFLQWIVSTDTSSVNYLDNPLSITLSGGTTYTVTPIFDPIQAPPGANLPTLMTNAAIVVVLAGAGGTTSPAPGTYAIANATTLQLKATASNGWQFSHWTIYGASSTHGGSPVNYSPTDNPYTVGHGYGYTYYYQPVFTQTGSPSPSSSTSTTAVPASSFAGISIEIWIIIALVVIIIAMAIIFIVFAMKRKK